MKCIKDIKDVLSKHRKTHHIHHSFICGYLVLGGTTCSGGRCFAVCDAEFTASVKKRIKNRLFPLNQLTLKHFCTTITISKNNIR